MVDRSLSGSGESSGEARREEVPPIPEVTGPVLPPRSGPRRPGSAYWMFGTICASILVAVPLLVANGLLNGRVLADLTWANPMTSLYAVAFLLLTAVFAFLGAFRRPRVWRHG